MNPLPRPVWRLRQPSAERNGRERERERERESMWKAALWNCDSRGGATTPGSVGGAALVKKRKMSGPGGPVEKRKRGPV